MYYEESAVSRKAAKEEKLCNGFLIAAIVLIAFTCLYVFLLYPVLFEVWTKEGLTTFVRIFNTVTWASFPFLGIALSVFFLLFKRRYNVSFDYTFVEDELRISKVFNGKKRKYLRTVKADQILKIGSCDKDSFERTRAGIPKKQMLIMTPNSEPAEGKEFFYILSSTSMEKVLIIIEARREILEYLVRAAGRTKYEAN